MVCGAGLVIMLVTAIAMPENKVLFGILTLLGSCMLFMIPLEKLLRYIKSLWGLLISFVIFLILYPVNEGYLGLGEWRIVDLPKSWYANLFSAYLGFPTSTFRSTDYFSILPWLFLFMAGYFLYRMFEEKKFLSYLNIGKNRVLERLGKHSLLIYMLHQPFAYGVLFLYYNIS